MTRNVARFYLAFVASATLVIKAAALVRPLPAQTPSTAANRGRPAAPVLSGAPAVTPVATRPLAFTGVTVIDVERGRRLVGQTVVVVGDRIRAIGRTGKVAVPAGARRVNAQGKYLIPGLWDLHVHTHTPSQMYPLLVASGVTGVRDAFSTLPLDTLRLWRRDILAGTLVGPPRQILSGAAIDENGCDATDLVGHICVVPGDTAAARQLVTALQSAGADMLKTYDLSREMYFTIAARARELGLPFGGHLGGSLGRTSTAIPIASAAEASDSGARILDHVNSAGGLDTLCLGPSASVARCRPLAERFRRNGTWWVPTLSHRLLFNESATPNPGPRAHAVVERLRRFADAVSSDSAPAGNWIRASAPSAVAHAGSVATAPQFLRVVREAGLPILAGTDAAGWSQRKQPPGLTLHAELAIYVAEGLTPLAALQTATLNPAMMWHATDSLGTVGVGKLADLVLLDADPLADITNTTTIRAVVANGRYYDRAALDTLLIQGYAKAAPP